MTTAQYVRLGRITTLSSFLAGTCIFVIYFFTSSDSLLTFGYLFTIVAVLINLGVLISIVFQSMGESSPNTKKLWMTCGLMLLNIPVVVFYIWVVGILLDTMRITFTNSTSSTLRDINIVGCKTEHIDRLEPGQSKTVWINIRTDCSIHIEYSFNGQQKSENVMGYATPGEGKKMKYNIGGQNENRF